MRVADALAHVERLFLDTAPVIYYVEKNPNYFDAIARIFDWIDNGRLTAITSPVTLAECLVIPHRLGSSKLKQHFFDLIVHGQNTIFIPTDYEHAQQAAELRAYYNITLYDAIQVATAVKSGCEALLSNDRRLQRVKELRVLIVDELEPDVLT